MYRVLEATEVSRNSDLKKLIKNLQELEMVLQFPSTTWMAVGWRPTNIDSSTCANIPLWGHRGLLDIDAPVVNNDGEIAEVQRSIADGTQTGESTGFEAETGAIVEETAEDYPEMAFSIDGLSN